MKHVEQGIRGSQSAYIDEVQKRVDLEDVEEKLAPLVPNVTYCFQMAKGRRNNISENGCLRFKPISGPDISYAVGVLSRFMQTPENKHMQGVKNI